MAVLSQGELQALGLAMFVGGSFTSPRRAVDPLPICSARRTETTP